MEKCGHLVIGGGEVGSALYWLLYDTHGPTTVVRDKEPVYVPRGTHMMHVCIPWSEDFPSIVRTYVRMYRPDITVVHSTVPVGTCDDNAWVHSPVRGQHPHLREGLLAFPKHVGGRSGADVEAVARALGDIGIRCIEHDRAATCEAGKLWELVQFGLQVAVRQEIEGWCADNGLASEEVYTSFGDGYNSGYSRLGLDKFVRPLLDYVPGPIGGHCVSQNSALLNHPLARMVAGWREGVG